MPSASSARLKGDDYQHLFSWWKVLALRKPSLHAWRVSIEAPGVGALDDVISHLASPGGSLVEYCQVKFHVSYGGQYSTDMLLQHKPTERSLLQKLYQGWQRIASGAGQIEVTLVSNWSWDPNDPVARLIDGRSATINPEFLIARPTTNVGECRQRWIDELGADTEDFARFIDVFHLQLGFDCTRVLTRHVEERMASIGLRWDEAALAAGMQQVRDWITDSVVHIEDPRLEKAIQRFHLQDENPEPFAVVHLHTIVRRAFSDPADYTIDWVDLFEGEEVKGHLPRNPQAWNNLMLPELRQLRNHIDAQAGPRRLRFRGQARLSAWIAAGAVFKEVAGFQLEAQQGPDLWRTDAPPAEDFILSEPNITELGEGSAVAIGISVTDDICKDVCRYLQTQAPEYGAVMFLTPNRPLGRHCFRDARDVVAFADQAKRKMQRFVRDREATRLGLFYLGPLSGGLFLGHQLNAVAREIQIFEDTQPGYAPSFLLSST